MTAVGMVVLVWGGLRAVGILAMLVLLAVASVLWVWEVPRRWRVWWALDEEAVVAATWGLVARRGLRKRLDELVHGR
jgi:hypothetical protein